jgi:hypothetical protein
MTSLPANPTLSVASLLQAMLLMLPRQWTSATLTVEVTGDIVRLDNITAEADGAAGARMPPSIVQQEELAEQGNVALAQLTGWRGPKVRLERAADGSARVLLLDADDAEHSRIDVTADAVLSFTWTDPLLDAMDDARERIGEAQSAFEATIAGFQRWDYDQDCAELSFTLANGEVRTRPAQLVGSWSKGEKTWLWAWDNPSILPQCWERVAPVRDASRTQPGLGALVRSPIACSQAAAVRLGAVASARIGAKGIFGGTHPGGVVIVAVTE